MGSADATIESHSKFGDLVMVMKFPVKKTLATPVIPIRSRRYCWSGSEVAVTVPGPPTGTPATNFMAFGLGVGVYEIAMGRG